MITISCLAKVWDIASGSLMFTIGSEDECVHSGSFIGNTLHVVPSEGEYLPIWQISDLEGMTDPQELLRRTGERTNARVCRDTLEVVSVLPYPDPKTVWAPEELCQPTE